ncbi:MAG: hypothetical protein JO007_16540 [Alphaproteobacteria bacterium]|nr:hypothetical protein [Alphaproteobacteria bacterium]
MAVSQAFPWVPALLIAALSALALAAETFPTRRSFVRQSRLAAIAILGISALATTVWQVWTDGEEIARLARHDRSTELQIRVKSLEQQLAKLEESTRGRSLAGDMATKLTNYLWSFGGGRKVVVSCIPNDIEAYYYATEIADVLKAAKWDARGPETTTIFGKISAMAVNVYDNAGSGSDTVKILLDGFEKYGIPYKTRVPPAEMLDPGAVELFIGTKPVQPDVIVETSPGTGFPPERNISGN